MIGFCFGLSTKGAANLSFSYDACVLFSFQGTLHLLMMTAIK
ncbi:hypothetical protein HNR34_001294 [Geobacillus subterraneus]